MTFSPKYPPQKLLDLTIVPSEAVFPGLPGDLCVKVCSGKLLLPSSTYSALEAESINVITASDLFLFFEEGPDDFARAMRWTIGQVRYAHWQLAHQLQGYVDPTLISFPQQTTEHLPDLSLLILYDSWWH